jgi:hypothetical protein
MKRLAPGLSAADQPDRDGLPKTRAEHTFGTVIADAIAEAILELPDGAGTGDAIRRAEAKLRAYGLDPDRLWLKRGHRTDDL